MGPLNTYYEQEVRVWLRKHPGKVITIYQVAGLFGAAYQKAATISTAISGFAKTGICPFNPNIFPDHMFASAETTDKPTSGDVSPAYIMGVPRVEQTEPRRQGIRRGKTVILTISPYLRELEFDLNRKRMKPSSSNKSGMSARLIAFVGIACVAVCVLLMVRVIFLRPRAKKEKKKYPIQVEDRTPCPGPESATRQPDEREAWGSWLQTVVRNCPKEKFRQFQTETLALSHRYQPTAQGQFQHCPQQFQGQPQFQFHYQQQQMQQPGYIRQPTFTQMLNQSTQQQPQHQSTRPACAPTPVGTSNIIASFYQIANQDDGDQDLIPAFCTPALGDRLSLSAFSAGSFGIHGTSGDQSVFRALMSTQSSSTAESDAD